MRAFRRLFRHFVSGLADNDLIAAGEDLHASIAGLLAACVVLSAGLALMFLGKYNSILTVNHGRLSAARVQTLPEKLAMALDDKTLLLGGAMIVMALIAVGFWDALALDERDLAVLGPLPVRPAAALAAKAAAGALAATVLAVALNALPAVLFPIVVLLKAPVGLAFVLRAIGAHAASGLAGCAFVFLALSTCRGAAGLFPSGGAVRRLLPLVQFVLILGLLSLLLALPALAGGTRGLIESGSRTALLYPPLWFLGLEEVLLGRTDPVFSALARIAVVALGLSLLAACAVHLASWLLRSHRVGAPAGTPDSRGARLIAAFLERVARLLTSDGRMRASFLFTARTLTRSPRHRLYLAGSLGLGLAVAGATIAAAYAGLGFGRQALNLESMALAGQLNLIFFLVIGLRIAATIPADLDAGWVFRFNATRARERHVAGTRAAIFFLAILPLLVILVPLHAWFWGGYAAMVHFAFGVVAALGLLEIVFTSYDSMPFVSSFVPGRTALTPRLGIYAFGYFLFAYLTPVIEQALIEHSGLFYAWVALFLVVIGRLFGSQSARLRRDQLPVFDDRVADVQQLGLWDAVHGRPDVPAGVAAVPETEGPLFAAIGREAAPRIDTASRSWASAAWQTWRDAVHAVRRLRASAGFTIFSVVTLAIAIGATTALYSVIYSSILRPLDVPELPGLVNLYHSDPRLGSLPMVAFSREDFDDLEKAQTVFSAVAVHAPFRQVVVANGTGEPALGELVSGRYFEVLGIRPAAGRLLQAADDRPGAPPVAVIDERTWRRRFDARPDIAGRTVRMAGHDVEIVGVTPAGFHGLLLPNLAPTAIWLPLQAAGLVGAGRQDEGREHRWLLAQGRLAPARTVEEAAAEVGLIGAQLDQAYPIGRELPRYLQSPPYVRRHWEATPAADRLLTERDDPQMIRLARLIMIAVALVLLVACTNLSNLMLARGMSRRKDIAVRLALGASRGQVIREQLIESAMVAGLGALGAFAVVWGLLSVMADTAIRLGPQISVALTPAIDLSMVMVGVSATGLALLAFGLVPALQLTRAGSSLAGSGSEGTLGTAGRWRGRRLLIASQVAVSVALVSIAGLCARHVAKAAAVETGIDLEHLAAVRFDFRVQGWSEGRSSQAVTGIAEEALRMSGVTDATVVSGLPLAGSGPSASLTTPDRPFDDGGYRGQRVTLVSGTPELFKALGVAIASGRPFGGQDTGAARRVVVLSQIAARRLFDSTDVVGRTVIRRVAGAAGRGPGVEALTVVGVAADTGRSDSRGPEGVAYVPLAQHYEPSLTVVARTRAPAMTVKALQDVTRRLQPELGIIDAASGRAIAGVESIAFEVMAALTALLGGLAMALAMTGLYGVLSYVVAGRTREIGIRIALGASTRQIVGLVMRDGVRPVVEGLVVGFVVADLVEMAIRPALQKPLPAIDATLLAGVPVPFLVAAVLACYLPSRRAAAVDPAVALRCH